MSKHWKKITLTTLLLVAVGCNYQKAKDIVQNPTTNSEAILAANSSELQELETSIHQQVNEYRRSQNLPPLTLDSAITEQARIHSQNMGDSNLLSHGGFEERVQAIAQTISYKSAAENVAFNLGFRDPGKRAVEGWIDSQGHQKNMVGDFDLTGLGVAVTPGGQYYFTQIFVLSR